MDEALESFVSRRPEASGLSALRPGFAWEEGYDRLFALGWPHLRVLVDGHRDDRDAAKSVKKVIDASLEGHYLVAWPRQVACRYVRAFGGRDEGALTTRNAWVAAAVREEARAPTEDEARAMLAARVRHGGSTGRWFVEHFALLLEAMVGTDAVLDALVGALEGEPATDEELETLVYTTGFLLLRVDQATATRQRTRLQAVLDAGSEDDYLVDPLSCVLRGGAGAKAVALNPVYYHHAVDDPEAVTAAVTAGRWLPSARHVFLGGEAVLEAVAPYWKRQKDAELQRKLAMQLAPIRSPVAVRILADMAAKSKVKEQLATLCAPLADHLLPELERLADDPAVGAGAGALSAGLRGR